MVHHDLLHQILGEQKKGPFVYPFYGKYSIAEIEPTVRTLFSIPTSRQTFPGEIFYGKSRRKVILLIIDGFGFNHLLDHGTGTPFFDVLMEKGDVYPITSVFPSTTPAALTSIHTGYTPQEHGLLEWFTYFEEFQKVIMPMQFRSRWDEAPNFLSSIGGKPEMLYERESLYETLSGFNVRPYVFLYQEYANSVYGDAVQRGSLIKPYHEGNELMHLLRKSLEGETDQAFYHVYWGQIDKAGHNFGPNSPEHRAAISSFSELMSEELLRGIDPVAARETLLILASDHGQISVAHDNIIYLEDYPYVWDSLKTNKSGELILPTGSPNDVFLFIRKDRVEKVIDYLREEIGHAAEILTTEEALSRGLFGLNESTQRFRNRAGNVMILPFPHYQVWFAPEGRREYTQLGLHGGLSQEEMIVPLGIATLSDLIPTI